LNKRLPKAAGEPRIEGLKLRAAGDGRLFFSRRQRMGDTVVATAEQLRPRRETGLAYFRQPRFGETAAWLISLICHLTALVLLAYCTMLVPIRERVLLSSQPVEIQDEPLPHEFQFSPEAHHEVGALGAGGLEAARPAALTSTAESQLVYELEPATPLGEIAVHEFDRTILEAPNITENLLVKGAGSVGTSGATGAVDRVTHEIVLSLDQRPTIVVWLFDQSGSLQAQREAIAKRFDRVYDELGVIEAAGNPAFRRHKDKPLLTAVASFGSGVELLTPKPTDDITDIKAAVRAVRDDPSGTENVFQSVNYLADKFRHHRLARPQRNVMIVVFTDEAGDDLAHLDAAVETCRKFEMPVYVVGVPAPFGREEAFVKYIDPDPQFDQSPQWVPVHQGPESLAPERIKLLFGGRQEQEDPVDSGFGPFGLCRLAYETGGMYFTVHPDRKVGTRIKSWETAAMSSHLASFFDPRVMRNYRPDYVTADRYLELVSSNRACTALLEAAQVSATTPMENIRRRFPRIDDGQFARDLSLAQREAAKLEPKINRLVSILRQGEADREQVTRPRWQAGYDLAIGRALAVKVRTEGYNAMLAEAKQGLKFKNEKSDTWELEPSESVTVSSALANDAEDARKYLQRVVAEHEGTPWALEAARELREPLGWKWQERFTDLAGRMARAQARNNRPQPERPEPPAKPRRDPPKL
jgi:von Willebrand factor type A domain